MSRKKGIFTKAELQSLLLKKHSCVVLKNSVIDVYLLPYYLNDVVAGLWNALYKKLKIYDSKLEGILLGYDNIKVDLDAGRFCGRNAEIKYPVSCDCYIFQPSVEDMLQGTVNQMSSDHIGCIVHQYFNATIMRPLNEDSEDWNNRCIDYDEVITFRVKDLDYTGFIPYIEGKLEEYPSRKKPSNRLIKAIVHDNNREDGETRFGKKDNSVISSTQIHTRDSCNFSESALEFDLLSPILKADKKKKSSTKESEDNPGGNQYEMYWEEGEEKASHSKNLKHQLDSAPVAKKAKKRKLDEANDGCSSSQESDVEKKKKKKRQSLLEILLPPENETKVPVLSSSDKIKSLDDNVVSTSKKKKTVNFESEIDEQNDLCTNFSAVQEKSSRNKKSRVSDNLVTETKNDVSSKLLVLDSPKRIKGVVGATLNSPKEKKPASIDSGLDDACETSMDSFSEVRNKEAIESVVKQDYTSPETPNTTTVQKNVSKKTPKVHNKLEMEINTLPLSHLSETIENVVKQEGSLNEKSAVVKKQSKKDKKSKVGEMNIISLSPISETIEDVVKQDNSSSFNEKSPAIKKKSKSEKKKKLEREINSSALPQLSETVEKDVKQEDSFDKKSTVKKSKTDKKNKVEEIKIISLSPISDTIENVVKQENFPDAKSSAIKEKTKSKNKSDTESNFLPLSDEKSTVVKKKSKPDEKNKLGKETKIISLSPISETIETVIKHKNSADETSNIVKKKSKLLKKNELEKKLNTLPLSPRTETIKNAEPDLGSDNLPSKSSLVTKKKKQSPNKKNVELSSSHSLNKDTHIDEIGDQNDKTVLKKGNGSKLKRGRSEPLKVTKKPKEKQDPDTKRLAQYLKKMQEIAAKSGKQDLLLSMLNDLNN